MKSVIVRGIKYVPWFVAGFFSCWFGVQQALNLQAKIMQQGAAQGQAQTLQAIAQEVSRSGQVQIPYKDGSGKDGTFQLKLVVPEVKK